jgi:hypothetical protein
MKQLSLFPKEYYIESMLKRCDQEQRINNVVHISQVIKISDMMKNVNELIF